MTVKNKVKVNKSFMKEFSNLNLTNNNSLPWLPEFLEMTYKCNLRFSNKYDKSCRSDLTINSTNQDFRTEASINAAYSLATAFDTVLKGCNGLVKQCFEKSRTDFYSRIEKALDDVRAFPKGGNPFIFKNRNATTSFSILNLQRSPNGKVRFLEVSSILVLSTNIQFKTVKYISPMLMLNYILKQCKFLNFIIVKKFSKKHLDIYYIDNGVRKHSGNLCLKPKQKMCHKKILHFLFRYDLRCSCSLIICILF